MASAGRQVPLLASLPTEKLVQLSIRLKELRISSGKTIVGKVRFAMFLRERVTKRDTELQVPTFTKTRRVKRYVLLRAVMGLDVP